MRSALGGRRGKTLFVLSIVAGVATGSLMAMDVGAGLAGSSYRLSDFQIAYPFDDPRPDVQPSLDVAGVSFLASWTTSDYPGEAQCQLRLMDATGQVVGTLDFSLQSATDGFSGPPMEVPVSRPPVSADGSCGEGNYPNPQSAGYEFRGPLTIASALDSVTGESVPGRTEIKFDVAWETPGVNPGMRLCSLVVVRKDGTESAPIEFRVNLAEGPETFNIEEDPATVQDASMSCRPL